MPEHLLPCIIIVKGQNDIGSPVVVCGGFPGARLLVDVHVGAVQQHVDRARQTKQVRLQQNTRNHTL